MSARPRVSVVMPVYNGHKYLRESIESVLAQTFGDWELVVMDNRSSDETEAIGRHYAAQDARVRFIRCEEFVDVHANHNRALRAIDAHSKYVKVLHADDWIYPDCLSRKVAVADAHPSVTLVSSYRLQDTKVMHDGFFPYTQSFLEGKAALRKSLLGPDWITGSPTSLLFRADVVRAEPKFFDDRVWHSDTDVSYRLMLQGDVGFVHQVLTFTRIHPGALTTFSYRVNSYVAQELRMLLRYGPLVLARDEYRAKLRQRLKEYLVFLAKQAVRPSRRRQEEFHRFHRDGIDKMLAESRGEREVLVALTAARLLLRDSSRWPTKAPRAATP
jgi:glycosyltransferase involved in cell wall biosynthesis